MNFNNSLSSNDPELNTLVQHELKRQEEGTLNLLPLRITLLKQ